MYELIIANKNYSSWSLRPWVLMRELHIPFTERGVLFTEGSSFEAFSEFSPTGQVPCLLDGDLTVWDSFGITEYLAERHPGVWPQDPAMRAWARCSAAEMHSGFGTLALALSDELRHPCASALKFPPCVEPKHRASSGTVERRSRAVRRPVSCQRKIQRCRRIFRACHVRVRTYNLTVDQVSAAYVARLLALPSMREWEAAALADTTREPSHEADTRGTGTLLEDRRAVG